MSDFGYDILQKKDGDGDATPKEPEPRPPNPTAKRVLVLAQKGDWPACEQALKVLERAAAEPGGDAKPLTNVSDIVSNSA